MPKAIAFFSQGIIEKNVGWLFPTIPDTTDILGKEMKEAEVGVDKEGRNKAVRGHHIRFP